MEFELEHKDKNKILKYIAALYDERSDLNQIADLKDRKIKACEKAGIDQKSTLAKDLMSLANESFNKAIFNYLSSQNHSKYAQLCVDQQLLWEMQQEILKPIEGGDNDERLKSVEYKDKVSVRSNALLQRINQMYSDIYKEDLEIQVAVRTIHDMMTYEDRLKKVKEDVR